MAFTGIRRWVERTGPAAPALVSGITAILLSVVLSLWLIERANPPRAQLGGDDAALLAGGFHGKEIGEGGRSFRWTDGLGIVHLPAYESSMVVTIGAQSGRDRAVRLTLRDGNCTIAVLRVIPQHRVYQVLWPQPCPTDLLHLSGVRELTLLSPTIPPRETDQRTLGLAVSSLGMIRIAGTPPWEPVGLTAVSIALVALLASPLRGRRHWLPWLSAIGLPLLSFALVWAPVPAISRSWLPLTSLPWLIAGSLAALSINRLSRSRRGAAAAAGLLLLILVLVLLGLELSWQVDGPDYGRHFSRSGSWSDVFRAHGYYPLGLPLILRLGVLAGDQALIAARIAALLATVMTALATTLLAWRMAGRHDAWLAALVLIGAPMTIAYGVLAGTDALFSGWVAVALLALGWSAQLRISTALLGGLALGLAYVFRFQALIVLLPVLLWALPLRCADCPPLRSRLARTLLHPVMLISLGFVIGSAPQWISEWLDSGRLINSQQHTNIWNFAFERYDAIPAPAGAELLYVLNYDPGTLLRHWLDNLRSFFEVVLHQLFVWPLGLIAVIAVAAAVPQLQQQRLRLLLLTIAGYLAVVALTHNKARFYLPIVPALTLMIVLQLSDWHRRLQAWQHPAANVLRTVALPALWLTIFAAVGAAAAELIIYRR